MNNDYLSTMVDPPTFTSIDKGGAISLEWVYADERLLFVWDPTAGAMSVKTSDDRQDSEESLSAATRLLEWLQEHDHENATR